MMNAFRRDGSRAAGEASRPLLNGNQRASLDEVLLHLERARSLLDGPGRWTQNAYARDRRGVAVGCQDGDAVAYCASGAIYAAQEDASPRSTLEARKLLYRTILDDIESWNDASGRTLADVLGAFDRAIVSLATAGLETVAATGPRHREDRVARRLTDHSASASPPSVASTLDRPYRSSLA